MDVVNSEGTIDQTVKQFYRILEPQVIHIRPGAASNDLKKKITDDLVAEGWCNLDINSLIRDENERRTDIGQEIHKMVSGNRIIPAEMIVRMLRKIIYSGDVSKRNFILTSFPDIID